MSVLCRLTVVTALFFFGLHSVDARHHEGGNRGDNNPGDMRPPLKGGHLPQDWGRPPPILRQGSKLARPLNCVSNQLLHRQIRKKSLYPQT